MALTHVDRIRHLVESGKWDEKKEKRAREILSDVQTIASNEERRRLKGRVQRSIESAKIVNRYGLERMERDFDTDNEEVEIEINSSYTGKKSTSRRNRARVSVRNYGFHVSGDGPLFVNQPSTNIIEIVTPDWDELHEFIGEDR